MVRVRCQRAVQRHDVGDREEIVERDVPHAQQLRLRVGSWIVSHQPATETRHDAGEDAADRPCPDDAHRAAVEVEAQQSGQREVPLPDACPCSVDLPVECQDQADRVFSDRVRRVGRDPHHRQSEPARRVDVDVVEAGRTQRDQAGPSLREALQHLRREVVVDVGADSGEAVRQRGGGHVEAGVEEGERVTVVTVHRGEELLVVRARAEHDHAHVHTLSSARR